MGAVLCDIEINDILRGYPLNDFLSVEEEQRIANLPPDHADRWKLVVHNMQFVVDFALKFARRNCHIFDGLSLIVALQDAMIRAARKFKACGSKFISFAYKGLHWAALDEAGKQATPAARMPTWGKDTKHLLREDGDYYQTFSDRSPEQELEQLVSGIAPEPFVAPDEALMKRDLASDLKKELRRVRVRKGEDKRTQEIIVEYYGDPSITLAKLGKDKNVVRERIRQVKVRGLEQMSRSKLLREHLG